MSIKKKLDQLNSALDVLEDKRQVAQLVKRRVNIITKDLAATDNQLKVMVEALKKERIDVDKLKKLSFANFYHTLINDKQEQLSKEETEVLEVKLKVDGIAAQRNAQFEALEKAKDECSKEVTIEGEWQKIFEEKKKLLEDSLPLVWREVEKKEAEISAETMGLKEITEALTAGRDAMNQVEKIQNTLKSAADWGTYDMLGGGLLATMAKRGHLDTAQQEMHVFQSHLKTFNRELSDVGETVSFDIEIDDFLSFADWFFDGFFVDWTVQSKIHNAQDQMVQLKGRISDILRQLNTASTRGKKRTVELKQGINKIIQEA